MSRVQYLWKKKMINTLSQLGLTESSLVLIERYFDGITDDPSMQQLTRIPALDVSASLLVQLFEHYEQWKSIHHSIEVDRLLYVLCRIAGKDVVHWLLPDAKRLFQWVLDHWLDDRTAGIDYAGILSELYAFHPEWFTLFAQTVTNDVKWLLYAEMIAQDSVAFAHLAFELDEKLGLHNRFFLEQYGYTDDQIRVLLGSIDDPTFIERNQSHRFMHANVPPVRIEERHHSLLLSAYRLRNGSVRYRNVFYLHLASNELHTCETISHFLRYHYADDSMYLHELSALREVVFEMGFGSSWIRWLLQQVSNGDLSFERLLAQEAVQSPHHYQQVMIGIYGLDYVILYGLSGEMDLSSKSIHKLERAFSDELITLFSQKIGERRQSYVYAFLAGRWPLDLLIERLRTQIPNHIGSTFAFERFLWIRSLIPQFDRAIQMLWIGDDYKSLIPVFELSVQMNGFEAWMNWMEQLQVKHHQLLSICLYARFQNDHSILAVASASWVEDQWRDQSDLIIMNWQSYSVKARVYLLSNWMEHDRSRMAPMFDQLTQDRSKRVQKLFVHSHPFQVMWQQDELTTDQSNDAVKEEANDVTFATEKELLLSPKSNEQILFHDEVLSRRTGERGRPKKILLDWIQWTTLPDVLRKDRSANVPDLWLRESMIAYARHSTIQLQPEATHWFDQMDEQSASEWIWQLFEQWIEQGAETKKKWVMVLAVLHGDDRVIFRLIDKLDEWPRNARGAIAIDAMRTMALTNRDEVLVRLAEISQESKIRQIREQAKQILDQFTEQHGVDKELFFDRLIPTFDFNASRERTFDYGTRSFQVTLTDDLQFEISDPAHKIYKSLPVPSRNDHPERSALAWEQMKWIRRQLPLTVSRQQLRLQELMVFVRYWSYSEWKKRMVMHPIMHSFATGLVWGIYENGHLLRPFVYPMVEEGQLTESTSITLLHPAELQPEDRDKWHQRISENAISAAIQQFDRPVEPCVELDEDLRNRFEGRKVRSDRLKAHLESRGWQMGSLQERGHVFTFYRENSYTGIGAQLSFSGMSMTDLNQSVSLESLRFYQAGKVVRGHYQTDDILPSIEIAYQDVPIRTWSEMFSDVRGALET